MANEQIVAALKFDLKPERYASGFVVVVFSPSSILYSV